MNIDWQQVCLNLRRHKPLTQVAKEVDCNYYTLVRISHGRILEPTFMAGLRLLDLHLKLCPERHKNIKF